ncbi:hypothetical protein H696_04965 [Fonticula alba]|uniref:Uncharacterized protein n=1 Tax=Fonticula alba TaxID=691883 RepID=A0A058Z303_FONAL|nr:hypothetical protein H696_04965 [Fonticula alba]KCV68674.1 hypothetical protein H696_04965 [Fonticula alba]|eukprot:XP_009497106.1 hypothetical protein H696_04965 [Fonticula alba]
MSLPKGSSVEPDRLFTGQHLAQDNQILRHGNQRLRWLNRTLAGKVRAKRAVESRASAAPSNAPHPGRAALLSLLDAGRPYQPAGGDQSDSEAEEHLHSFFLPPDALAALPGGVVTELAAAADLPVPSDEEALYEQVTYLQASMPTSSRPASVAPAPRPGSRARQAANAAGTAGAAGQQPVTMGDSYFDDRAIIRGGLLDKLLLFRRALTMGGHRPPLERGLDALMKHPSAALALGGSPRRAPDGPATTPVPKPTGATPSPSTPRLPASSSSGASSSAALAPDPSPATMPKAGEGTPAN